MEKTKKNIWSSPYVVTVQNKDLKQTINISACSRHTEGCWPSMQYIDAIPGKPPVEIM